MAQKSPTPPSSPTTTPPSSSSSSSSSGGFQQLPNAILDPISDFFHWPLGSLLESFANETGLKYGIVERKYFWYLPPGQHVFELFFWAIAFYLLWIFFTSSYLKKTVVEPFQRASSGNSGRRNKNKSNNNVSNGKVFNWIERICGIILALCWISQLVFKLMRPKPAIQIFWLLMPCHIITFLWAWLLLQPSKNNNKYLLNFVASFLCTSSWGGIMAAAFPDWSDHQYRIEGIIFFIHHGVLVLIPHIWLWFNNNNSIHNMSLSYIATYWNIWGVVNYFVYTPVSFFAMNLNYCLHPHLGMMKLGHPMFNTRWYRFIAPVALVAFGAIYYQVVLKGGHFILTKLVQLFTYYTSSSLVVSEPLTPLSSVSSSVTRKDSPEPSRPSAAAAASTAKKKNTRKKM